jgi:outer membrane receptor protein involved in Fe transport
MSRRRAAYGNNLQRQASQRRRLRKQLRGVYYGSRGNSGGYFNRQTRESLRYEAQTIYSLPAFNWIGQHLLKVGGGFAYTTFDGTSGNTPVRITRSDGTVNQLQTYLGTGILRRNKSDIGLFVQDKWTINPRITFDLGVRFDRDSLAKTFNPAPRLGFVIAPFGDLKLSFAAEGRFLFEYR